MLAENERRNQRLKLWVITGILIMVAVLALLWSDVGVSESLSPTQTPAQEIVWRECNPYLEVKGDKTWSWNIPTPTPTPRIWICDCILKQIATPTPTPTPRVLPNSDTG